MAVTEAMHVRSLAAAYRSRAAGAEPAIARLLAEIADDLEVEASRLDGAEAPHR